MSETCKICGKHQPSEGRVVCDRCLGFESAADPDAATLLLCRECGQPIVPFKLGRNTVTSGRCRDCMNVFRGRKISATMLSRSAQDGEQRKPRTVSAPLSPKPPRPSSVTIPFEGADKTLLRHLQLIAGKERRSIEQQILYLLDQCALETFVMKYGEGAA